MNFFRWKTDPSWESRAEGSILHFPGLSDETLNRDFIFIWRDVKPEFTDPNWEGESYFQSKLTAFCHKNLPKERRYS